MCMVAVVSAIVVCAVKSSVGSILFCRPAPLKLTRPSVKFRRPVASEKVPRSRSKPPLTSGESVVPLICRSPRILASSPLPCTRISSGACTVTLSPIMSGFPGAAGFFLPRRRTSSTATLSGSPLGMPIKVRLRCMVPATSRRSRAVPLIERSALKFDVMSLLTSGWALRAVTCKSTGIPFCRIPTLPLIDTVPGAAADVKLLICKVP